MGTYMYDIPFDPRAIYVKDDKTGAYVKYRIVSIIDSVAEKILTVEYAGDRIIAVPRETQPQTVTEEPVTQDEFENVLFEGGVANG